MARYTHSFDTRIAVSFESDIEDFDAAFDTWIDSFSDAAAKRAALLNGDESTWDLMKGVIHNWTEDTQNPETPFSC
jgi:hypothetical protein